MERVWQQIGRLSTLTGARLIGGLAGLIFLGTVLLSLPGVAVGGRLNAQEALFTAVSALTVTGLSLITPGQDLTILGQVILLLLIQTGGVGFVVAVVFILRLLGRRINYQTHQTLREDLGIEKIGSAIELTWMMLKLTLAVEGVGTLALWMLWTQRLGTGKALFFAVFHAVSSFCNAGFELFSGLDGTPTGIPQDAPTLLVMGTLIFLGGLGIPILVNLQTWRMDRQISLHTRLTLVTVGVLIVLGGIGFFVSERGPGRLLETAPVGNGLVLAFFQSISARTAGFSSLSPFSSLAPASQLLMMGLMFIGSAPVSMGGGITTGTFITLALGVWGFVRGQRQMTVHGRTITTFTVRRATIVLVVSLGVVFLATLLLLISHPATLDQALFEVVSAFATCGLSLDFTRQLNGWGQFIIMGVMFWGRLGPLSIMVALRQLLRASRISYPQEEIMIG